MRAAFWEWGCLCPSGSVPRRPVSSARPRSLTAFFGKFAQRLLLPEAGRILLWEFLRISSFCRLPHSLVTDRPAAHLTSLSPSPLLSFSEFCSCRCLDRSSHPGCFSEPFKATARGKKWKRDRPGGASGGWGLGPAVASQCVGPHPVDPDLQPPACVSQPVGLPARWPPIPRIPISGPQPVCPSPCAISGRCLGRPSPRLAGTVGLSAGALL